MTVIDLGLRLDFMFFLISHLIKQHSVINTTYIAMFHPGIASMSRSKWKKMLTAVISDTDWNHYHTGWEI